MKLIVGLGNPGQEYESTRHNVGFEVMDVFKDELERLDNEKINWRENKKLECELIKVHDYILIKPLTFMNLSGRAVAKVTDYYQIDHRDVVLIHDDLDLNVGVINIRSAGGSGGHHGVDSVKNVLGDSNFIRIRVGVGKKENKQVMTQAEGVDYVLSKFGTKERELIEDTKKKCVEALFCCLTRSIEQCQNIYNKKISNNLPMED